jgi:hypothetical protein
MKKKIKIKSEEIMHLPAKIYVITESGPVSHWIESEEDLSATLMIAESQGWRVEYKHKTLVE